MTNASARDVRNAARIDVFCVGFFEFSTSFLGSLPTKKKYGECLGFLNVLESFPFLTQHLTSSLKSSRPRLFVFSFGLPFVTTTRTPPRCRRRLDNNNNNNNNNNNESIIKKIVGWSTREVLRPWGKKSAKERNGGHLYNGIIIIMYEGRKHRDSFSPA